MLMIRSQDKWLNSNVCDVSVLSQAPQASRQRRQPSVTRAAEHATDRRSGCKASDKGPTELMMSRTAVKPASVEIVIANVFGQTSLSLRLSPAPGRAGRERSCGSQTETNNYLLSYNLNLRRTGRGCSDTARDSRTRPMFQN